MRSWLLRRWCAVKGHSWRVMVGTHHDLPLTSGMICIHCGQKVVWNA